ncbi:MAG: anthranilate synthase component I, partial [Planctomycetes bacterium]|nr:anthranilate synthase component I [Planctomycetota bacterium]
MNHKPDLESFRSLAQEANLVPVYRQLTSDTLTPVEAFCKLQWGECSFLFESVVGGERIGRYSFVGSDPFLRIEAYGNDVIIRDGDEERRFTADDPLAELEALLANFKAAHLPELPGFCGGAGGYAGHDIIRHSEHPPDAPTDDRQLPDPSFGVFDRVGVLDPLRETGPLICHPPPGTAGPE